MGAVEPRYGLVPHRDIREAELLSLISAVENKEYFLASSAAETYVVEAEKLIVATAAVIIKRFQEAEQRLLDERASSQQRILELERTIAVLVEGA